MMRINLPSCIKKVECLSMQKSENRSEIQEQQQNQNSIEVQTQQSSIEELPNLVANLPGPSCSEEQEQIPSDKAGPSATEELKNESQVAPVTKSTAPQKPSEKKTIDDALLCKICYDDVMSVVFLPCSHTFACIKCAPSMSVCAICREPVTMLVRTIFS